MVGALFVVWFVDFAVWCCYLFLFVLIHYYVLLVVNLVSGCLLCVVVGFVYWWFR